MSRGLPNGINENLILEAIKLISSGRETNFSDSTKFDLYYNGNRYPPKAVIGLAAELHTGEAYYPSDFSGGLTSKCFRILKGLGFQIVPKLNLSLNYDYDPPIYDPNSYEPNRRSVSNRDFSGKSTYSKPSKLVGEKGETYVYEFEKNKLIKAGRVDLAQKIVMQCQDLSSYPGYDILSYTIDGDEMFIEVKSTKTKKKGFFEISSNEVEAAKKYGDSYYIYHVTNTLNEPQIANIFQNPMQLSERDKASMRPFMYKFEFVS